MKPTFNKVVVEKDGTLPDFKAPTGVFGVDWFIFDDHVCVNENVCFNEDGSFSLSFLPVGVLRVLCLCGQDYQMSD